MIEVIILGSGTGVPYLPRSSSSYCVQIDGEALLFEMGAGAVRRLTEAGIDYKAIKQLFITHRHPDHCSDLIPFLFAMNYTPDFKRADRLDLYGPLGFGEVVRKLMGIFPWITPKQYPFDIHELQEAEIQGRHWKIKSKPTIHGDVPALSYRIEAYGKVIAYSGDSGYCEELIENARGADLFIVECSYPESMELKGVHLNSREVGEAASRAGVKRVILTHLYPFCDQHAVVEEVKRIYRGNVEKGKDFMRVTL